MHFHAIPPVHMSAVTFRWKMPYSSFIVSKSIDSQFSSSGREASVPELGIHSSADTVCGRGAVSQTLRQLQIAVPLNLVRSQGSFRVG